MGFDGFDAEAEDGGGFLIGSSFGQELDDITLTAGQFPEGLGRA